MNLSEVLFPPTCIGCGSLGVRICLKCSYLMRPIRENWCLSCGNILKKVQTCGYCEGKKETLPVLGCWYYESTISRAVWSFKYKKDKQILYELSSRISPETLSSLLTLKEKHNNAIFVPVPLYKTRVRERGYNQSQLFATFLSAITKIPTTSNAIYRQKNTKPQAKCKSKKERTENIQGAFIVADKELLKGKTIILVDDVVTTGSTAKEISREIQREIKKAELSVVCLAREQDSNMEKHPHI